MSQFFRYFVTLFGHEEEVMVATVNAARQPNQAQSFVETHFLKIAFAVSTLALLILSPLQFMLGVPLSLALHYWIAPSTGNEPILTLPNTLFTMIGAVGAFIKCTPAGLVGGTLFQMIPLLSTWAVGNTIYRAIR